MKVKNTSGRPYTLPLRTASAESDAESFGGRGRRIEPGQVMDLPSWYIAAVGDEKEFERLFSTKVLLVGERAIASSETPAESRVIAKLERDLAASSTQVAELEAALADARAELDMYVSAAAEDGKRIAELEAQLAEAKRGGAAAEASKSEASKPPAEKKAKG